MFKDKGKQFLCVRLPRTHLEGLGTDDAPGTLRHLSPSVGASSVGPPLPCQLGAKIFVDNFSDLLL